MVLSEINISYSCRSKQDSIISSSEKLFECALNNWNIDTIEVQEIVKVIMFNNTNQAIGVYELSKGGITSSIIDLRLLLSVALKCLATAITIIHNHPSGNLNPSEADINITTRIKKACEILDIKLLDHLIISKTDYYSFADNGSL